MASYTTATLVEAELRADAVFSSSTVPTLSQVTTWIQEESAYIEALTNRSYESVSYTEYVDYNGEDIIVLENAPVISITSVEYNKNVIGSALGADWETKTEDTHYTVYSDTGTIKILRNRWNPSFGDKRLRIIYTAGYASTPTDIQMLTTKRVALRVVETMLFENAYERNSGGSISVGAINIVEPDDISVGTIRALRESIEELKRVVVDQSRVFRVRW